MTKPPLRPIGRRGGTNMMLTWALLLLFAAAAQSQSPIQAGKDQNIVASTRDTHAASSNQHHHPAGRSPAEIPALKHDITTVKFRNTDNNPDSYKFHALAPVSHNAAVRAPSAPQSVESSSGLSALTPARLLQNWEVENIVLLATVDGKIYARDRLTGQERWSLEIPGSPMINTTHYRATTSIENDEPTDDDYMFIVEPSKDGNLYVQYKDPRKGLQRLGVTVKSLAAETPQIVDNPPLVTIAEQETTAYVIDAATGNIEQQFNKHKALPTDNTPRSCRPLNNFELEDTACKQIGTFNLGRIQYTISIMHKITGEPLCTIKFAEWVPNKVDSDLQSQYSDPLDNMHIQGYYNGRIIGLDSNSDTGKFLRFNQKLDSPVARVFDLVRPQDTRDEVASLVLLSRPLDSQFLAASYAWQNEAQRMERVFVNRTDSGVWYAMSELSYPGVTSGAADASAIWNHENLPLDFESDLSDIVGVHVLSDQATPQIPLTISGPPANVDLVETSEGVVAPFEPPRPPALLDDLSRNWSSVLNVVLLGIVLFIFGVQMKIPAMLKMQNWLRKAGIEVTINEKVQPVHPDGVLQTTVERTVNLSDESSLVAAVAETMDPGLVTPARSRAQSAAVTMTSPARSERAVEFQDNSSDGESDDDKPADGDSPSGETGEKSEQPKKRHAKRGKRGGKKNRKGKKSMDPEIMDEIDVIAKEILTKDGLLQVGKLKLDSREEACLGRGSNGTAVFPGTLDGREVAVKRLIRSANSLAAKEIKHLLSSDENAHVIRYFGKEESQHFTYIALDLFATSLDQFVERPLEYPSLVKLPEGYDVKDCLRQITDGVQHLHSLKLVHRDIKPQNILVRAVKNSRPITGLPKLQFVISDFGLCKPLEEGPESTFAPTANHTAAGTTGWRAPELLVNSRAGTHAITCSNASKSTTHSSDDAVIDPPTGRRATKAIDIFSLGCVFYYVMTQGRHPFDVGGTSLGRDLNIKENKYSTDDLRLHDYQFDADDLIMQMLKNNPRERPDTATVLRHPYFWDVSDKLEFLCDVSDCYEREKNSINNIFDENAMRTPAEKESLAELAALESLAPNVIGPTNDFLRALPRNFINEMGKQRKYTGSRMIDLLRVIRNKKNHFHDLPDDVKELMLGGSARGYYEFWVRRFPSLLINCHCIVIERGLVRRFRMERYFS